MSVLVLYVVCMAFFINGVNDEGISGANSEKSYTCSDGGLLIVGTEVNNNVPMIYAEKYSSEKKDTLNWAYGSEFEFSENYKVLVEKIDEIEGKIIVSGNLLDKEGRIISQYSKDIDWKNWSQKKV